MHTRENDLQQNGWSGGWGLGDGWQKPNRRLARSSGRYRLSNAERFGRPLSDQWRAQGQAVTSRTRSWLQPALRSLAVS